ncbi:CAP domain-containing protein [Pseudonocardia hispaniensis]|uniref:CAP domain-containing protein n=1 Tax=Pseudonocardia hispaniensis TaxID=904933 RepID=A0ABW1J3K5_9PSEU
MIRWRRRNGTVLLVGLVTGGLLAGFGTAVGGSAQPTAAISPPGNAAALGEHVPATSTANRTTPAAPAPAGTVSAIPVPSTTPAVPTPLSTSVPPTRERLSSPTPSTAAPAPGPAAQVVALTNQERARHGCTPLRVDLRIAAVAQQHSSEMAETGHFAHTSPDGTRFDQRIRAQGYPAPGAENIARGQPDAKTVVAAWMASPGHRANILNCSLVAVGVGHDPRGNYWTQDFGR